MTDDFSSALKDQIEFLKEDLRFKNNLIDKLMTELTVVNNVKSITSTEDSLINNTIIGNNDKNKRTSGEGMVNTNNPMTTDHLKRHTFMNPNYNYINNVYKNSHNTEGANMHADRNNVKRGVIYHDPN